jgi:hypothetical protein
MFYVRNMWQFLHVDYVHKHSFIHDLLRVTTTVVCCTVLAALQLLDDLQ